jgi:hypothetical protein
MFMSRSELRNAVNSIDAYITRLRIKHPIDADLMPPADGIFSEAMAQCDHEDNEWLLNTIDEVCTRHRMPYPYGAISQG